MNLANAFEEVTLGPRLPAGFSPRPHQKEALRRWQNAGYSGILAMATGSGKTKTALYAAERIYSANGRLFLLVAVPFVNLAEQWCDEMGAFSITPIRCFGGKASWVESLKSAVHDFQQGFRSFVAVVVVNRTLASVEFQRALRKLAKERDFLFIGDECHNHGTQSMLSALPLDPGKRLGLSATFERFGDETGTAGLVQYYGGVAFEFSLRDALYAVPPILCKYEYHVHFVRLTKLEAETYQDISKRIINLIAKSGSRNIEIGGRNPPNPQLDLLLFQRARLIGSAQNKLVKLKELIEHNDPGPFSLVYCGDGRVETDPDEGEPESESESESGTESDVRHIDAVVKMLSSLGKKVGRYTYEESAADHRMLLDAFRAGRIEILAAIRCLDEGIDVPACRTGYILASSRNPRQFVQRRGRLLRHAPGKDQAIIHDFVVRLPELNNESLDLERSLLLGELKRVREFASEATNSTEVYRVIDPVIEEYGLWEEFLATR